MYDSKETIKSTVNLVSAIFNELPGSKENLMLHGTVATETQYGLTDKYNVAQVTRIAWEATRDLEAHPGLAKWHQVLKERRTDWMSLAYESVVQHPIYNVIAARLYYKTIPEAVPETRLGRAGYWKRYYNTSLGAGDVEAYLKRSDPKLS
jgi:hypothetical protein